MDGLIDGNLVKGWIDGELEKYTVGVDEVGTEGLSVVIIDGATVGEVLGSYFHCKLMTDVDNELIVI